MWEAMQDVPLMGHLLLLPLYVFVLGLLGVGVAVLGLVLFYCWVAIVGTRGLAIIPIAFFVYQLATWPAGL